MALDKILELPRGTLIDAKEYKNIASSIELNPIATEEMIKSLKAVPKGETPMDLIFAIEYENSTNYRKYTTNAYRSIVKQILTSDVFIPVCFGHQNPQTAHFDARRIVGSVIGAHLDEEAGLIYYRVIPDASEDNADIRRWLRNKQINALSIWGYSVLKEVEDGIEVIDDFRLVSIDLVPPLSEGQANVGLIISETQKRGLRTLYEDMNIEHFKNYNIGGHDMPNNELQLKDISNAQLLGEMTSRLREGRLALKTAIAEMDGTGVASEDELKEKESKVMALQKEVEDLLAKVKEAGFQTFDELLKFAQDAKKAEQEGKEKEDFDKNFKEIMESRGLIKDGKPTGAMAEFVDKWAGLAIGMSLQEMAEKIDKVIKDDTFIRLAGEKAGAEARNVGGGATIDKDAEAEVYTI